MRVHNVDQYALLQLQFVVGRSIYFIHCTDTASQWQFVYKRLLLVYQFQFEMIFDIIVKFQLYVSSLHMDNGFGFYCC